MRNILKVLVFLVLALGLVGFAMLNAERRVTIDYLPGGASLHDVPVFIVILGAMLAGVLVAGVVSALDQVRARARIRTLERELAAVRTEVQKLRNLPLEEEDPDGDGPGPVT